MGDGKGAIVEPDITLSPEVQEVLADVIAIRREIHAHPELAIRRCAPRRWLPSACRQWGCPCKPAWRRQGVVGLLEGGQPVRSSCSAPTWMRSPSRS